MKMNVGRFGTPKRSRDAAGRTALRVRAGKEVKLRGREESALSTHPLGAGTALH